MPSGHGSAARFHNGHTLLLGLIPAYQEARGDGVAIPDGRSGGVVEKFIGDAVVGLFGVPAQRPAAARQTVAASTKMSAVHFRISAGSGSFFVAQIGQPFGLAESGWRGVRLRVGGVRRPPE